jgi:hypothetical protein
MAASDASQVVPGAAFDALVELVQGLQLPPVEAYHVAEAVVPAFEKVVHTYAEAHKTVLNSIASMRSGWSCLASAASFAPSRAVPQSSRGSSLPVAAPSPDADLDVAALRSEIEHGNHVIAELQIQNENAKQQNERLQQHLQELSAECEARIESARNENEKLQLQVSELQALLSRGASASEPDGALAIQLRMDSNADVEAAPPSEGKVAAQASASERVRHGTMSSFALCPNSRVLQAAAAARIVGKPDVIEAAERGDFELVKDHVVADAGCVHKTNEEYVCQLLARAAEAHDFSNRAILQLRSFFLISVISGYTALMWSSREGHLETTRLLVESGANVEATDTVLYSTPKTRCFKCCAPLQFRSIFVISVISGETALIHSTMKGHLETTRFLVESGANVEAKTNQYYTPY